MNVPDPFEERLAQVPFRPPPPSLREQVLEAASQAALERKPRPRAQCAWSIAEWLWPHPVAWGTLALAWVVIVLLNFAALESPVRFHTHGLQSLTSPAWTAALREQRAMLQSLLADPPSAALPEEPGPGAQLWQRVNRRTAALA